MLAARRQEELKLKEKTETSWHPYIALYFANTPHTSHPLTLNTRRVKPGISTSRRESTHAKEGGGAGDLGEDEGEDAGVGAELGEEGLGCGGADAGGSSSLGGGGPGRDR